LKTFKKIIIGFTKGILLGFLILPFVLMILSSVNFRVRAQEDLREQAQDLRNEARDEVLRPCSDNPREGCAVRPIPDHRPSAAPSAPASSQAPSSAPSSPPGPSSTPGPASSSTPASPSPGVGGPSESASPSPESGVVQAPVKGLSFTCSGRW